MPKRATLGPLGLEMPLRKMKATQTGKLREREREREREKEQTGLPLTVMSHARGQLYSSMCVYQVDPSTLSTNWKKCGAPIIF